MIASTQITNIEVFAFIVVKVRMGSHSTKGHLFLVLIFNNRHVLRFRTKWFPRNYCKELHKTGGNVSRGTITKIGQKISFSVKSKQYFFQTSCATQFLCAYNLKSCLEYKNMKKSPFWAIIYKILLFWGH